MATFKYAALIKVTFTGANGSGSCSAPGLEVGDILLGQVRDETTGNLLSALDFEQTITVADQFQQNSASNYSADTLHAVFARAAP